jgi:hypothetical protein
MDCGHSPHSRKSEMLPFAKFHAEFRASDSCFAKTCRSGSESLMQVPVLRDPKLEIVTAAASTSMSLAY